MKKVLFSIPSMSGGGAERVVSIITEELSHRGYDIFIYSDFNYKKYSIGDKVKTIQRKNKLLSFKGCCEFRKVVKETNPDIVVSMMTDAFVVSLISMIGLKKINIASDHTSFERKLPWHQTFVRKYLYKLASKVTILSKRDSCIIGNNITNKIVLPNPVLVCDNIKDMNSRSKCLIGVGRLDSWHIKGFDILINEWSKIAHLYPDWKLILVGEGKMESVCYLNSIARLKGLSNSQFEIQDFKDNISRFMQDTSIFVLSSRVEGFGLVLLEAMSNGCACIAFDSQGRQKEIIKESGITISIDNSCILSDSIELLINNPELRSKYSKLGFLRSKDFSAKKIADRWELIFKDN